MNRAFRGWWMVFATLCTFGISVGLPYYNNPFFYDYYQKTFGWQPHSITLGFPIAALLTLWVGPVLIPRFSPRKLIVVGTFMTFLAFFGWSRMSGNLNVYYALWFLYTVGYILSGPIPHQIMISQWFRKKRGLAMGMVYVGVGLVGAAGSYMVKPLAENYGFRTALLVIGCMMFLTWPLALFVLKDKPSDIGQFPDGDLEPPAESKIAPVSYKYLLQRPSFWLLLIGSLCSIGAIGAVNVHMKLVFRDAGFTDQATLNSVWRVASICILISSIAGRLLIGFSADKLPMKNVMTVTYFIVAATIPLLLMVKPGTSPVAFAVIFGFAMGADYMLIPLMAARQFGVNSLARAMAIILPVNTIGQTWVPEMVSLLKEHYGSYAVALNVVLVLAVVGAVAILLLPKQTDFDETLPVQDAPRAAARS
jgi:MFS family permease